MQEITRRSALIVGASLAFAGSTRKSTAQRILTPTPDAPVHPLGIAALHPLPSPAEPKALTFRDAQGGVVSLADFRGSGIVLNLWATWCTPCVAEMPALDALAAAVAGENIRVMPLSSDRGGSAVVQRFYVAHDIRHLGIWIDPKAVATQGWGARGLPTTLIIDRLGREVARLEGSAQWNSPAVVARIRALV